MIRRGDVDTDFSHRLDRAGLMESAGADPAERTSTLPWLKAVRKPAAICERPALWTHTNSTLGRDVDMRHKPFQL